MSIEACYPFFAFRESGEGRIINSISYPTAIQVVEVCVGRVVAQIGTDFVEAKKGDFIYVPPAMMFRLDSLDGVCSVRGIVFDKSVFIGDIENFDSEILYMFDVQFKNKPFVFTEEYPVRSVFATCMEDATDEYSSKDVCYRLPVKANIYKMMTALLRYYSGVRDDLDRVVYHNVLRLRDVVYYIAEHYTEKIYIEKLAEMVNVSADYFTKMFRDSIGKTPIEYINALRVNGAMEMLCNTELSMAEIADKIGFCNPNYFHKIFKQYMNVGPLAYRKATK